MIQHEDNDVPYRAPIQIGNGDPVSDKDEADQSTLESILKIIVDARAKCGDMHTIDLEHPSLNADQQVLAYQFALNEIIDPIEATVTSTINDIKLKQRGE